MLVCFWFRPIHEQKSCYSGQVGSISVKDSVRLVRCDQRQSYAFQKFSKHASFIKCIYIFSSVKPSLLRRREEWRRGGEWNTTLLKTTAWEAKLNQTCMIMHSLFQVSSHYILSTFQTHITLKLLFSRFWLPSFRLRLPFPIQTRHFQPYRHHLFIIKAMKKETPTGLLYNLQTIIWIEVSS